uniref:E74 like ETS transcription factor 2 n=2 Tax=Rousettus aegyptiacus TaxID=9407 RepID=A0A7J8BQ76_ROUAE|nr:E74 like ETS transcription factor 2 [Rousettus aegyptiacus]
MTSAVVDSGGSILELSSNGVENQEESEKVSEYPAVIVEPVPSARLEQGYAAQVLVYDDETYMMQDVAEEQEVETENVETGRKYLCPVAADSTSSGDLLCGPMG